MRRTYYLSGVLQVVEPLLSKREAQSSNPSTTKPPPRPQNPPEGVTQMVTAPAFREGSPEFKPQSHQKKKKKIL
jgi:hypothetical protein